MKVTPSAKLPGVLIIEPEVHPDLRGDYVMVYNEKEYAQHGMGPFVEHCISTSRFGTLRGLHGDFGCDKLLQCLHGELWYVLADPQTFLWESFVLTGRNHLQLYKPRQYLGGLLALTDDAVFAYAQSEYYDPGRQVTVGFNSGRFNIAWPMKPTFLSRRDEKAARDEALFPLLQTLDKFKQL